MRDRLIELLEEAKTKAQITIGSLNNGWGAWYADYLLENGVIVPPCNVGDTVYFLGGLYNRLIKAAIVEEIILNSNGVSDLLVTSENGITFENSIDTFYFSKEEAEAALRKEGEW